MSEPDSSRVPYDTQTYEFDVTRRLTSEESETFAAKSLPIAVSYLRAKLHEADSKDAHSRTTIEVQDYNPSQKLLISNYAHIPEGLKDAHWIDALSLPVRGKDDKEGKPLSIVFTKQPGREGRITIYENTVAKVLGDTPREQSLDFKSPDGRTIGTTGLGTVYPYQRDGYIINLFTPHSISDDSNTGQSTRDGASSTARESEVPELGE